MVNIVHTAIQPGDVAWAMPAAAKEGAVVMPAAAKVAVVAARRQVAPRLLHPRGLRPPTRVGRQFGSPAPADSSHKGIAAAGQPATNKTVLQRKDGSYAQFAAQISLSGSMNAWTASSRASWSSAPVTVSVPSAAALTASSIVELISSDSAEWV